MPWTPIKGPACPVGTGTFPGIELTVFQLCAPSGGSSRWGLGKGDGGGWWLMVDGGNRGWVIADTSSSEQAKILTYLTQQPEGAERFCRAGHI